MGLEARFLEEHQELVYLLRVRAAKLLGFWANVLSMYGMPSVTHTACVAIRSRWQAVVKEPRGALPKRRRNRAPDSHLRTQDNHCDSCGKVGKRRSHRVDL